MVAAIHAFQDDEGPAPGQPLRGRVTRVSLSRFRSYRAASLEPQAALVALVGPNGAGKTNVLEALSFLTPGRGLRRATLAEAAFDQGDGGWAVSATLDGPYGETLLGTGIDGGDPEVRSRQCRIDRASVGSAAAFADHIRVIWLTPAMDGLFLGSAGERRRFLDRLVLAVDAEHGSRVNALERSLRSRNRLLEEISPDPAWLDAVEHETAELAVAVAAARAEAVRRLAGLIEATKDPASPFPFALLALDGMLEAGVLERPPSRWRTSIAPSSATIAIATGQRGGPRSDPMRVIFSASTARRGHLPSAARRASRRHC